MSRYFDVYMNFILNTLSGGHTYGTSGRILEYIPEDHTWTEIGGMMEAREDHAISVVKTSDFWQWCCGPDDSC